MEAKSSISHKGLLLYKINNGMLLLRQHQQVYTPAIACRSCASNSSVLGAAAPTVAATATGPAALRAYFAAICGATDNYLFVTVGRTATWCAVALLRVPVGGPDACCFPWALNATAIDSYAVGILAHPKGFTKRLI